VRAVVIGLAVTGASVCRALLARGASVTAVDDRGGEDVRRRAEDAGVELVEAPAEERLAELVAAADLVVVSPGVPASHPVFRTPTSGEVVSEVELASRWCRVPMVAVTGTNGKTTVVTLITRMLAESGRRTVAAGNIGLPLIDAVEGEADVLVVEVSSFQLALTRSFRPQVAVWLNLSEDHLDWHPDVCHYAASKARIWANQRADDTAVVNAGDDIVMGWATTGDTRVASRLVTFGPGGDYRVEGGRLLGPEGADLMAVADMARALPHDVDNALAAWAAAAAAGATTAACADVLRDFAGLPHRVALVGESGGVRFYDDSKATTPASVLAALAGFDSVVLIAGGRNKGLDLSVLRGGADHLRAAVAIGESAAEVEAALAPAVPVRRAGSMAEAVRMAASEARPGDVVLLSPGCASFDWYRSYAERGYDFVRQVRGLAEETS